VIGVNIMGVIGRFTQLLNAAIEEKVDLIVQGAGFRYDTFDMAKAANIPVFSIASSLKVAQKAEAAGAAAIVIEGADAGGHLGFPHGKPFRKTIDILKEVVAAGIKLPLIAAGRYIQRRGYRGDAAQRRVRSADGDEICFHGRMRRQYQIQGGAFERQAGRCGDNPFAGRVAGPGGAHAVRG